MGMIRLWIYLWEQRSDAYVDAGYDHYTVDTILMIFMVQNEKENSQSHLYAI